MEYRKLNCGIEMPVLGYGVYQTPPEDTERCVSEALEVGYRLIDTASSYGNEEGVGAAIAKSPLSREDVFVTSKIWVSDFTYERATAAIDAAIDKIGGYVDLMLLHQAMGDYPGAWRALEDAYRKGKLRAIGVSNFYPERLIDICALAEIPPAVNQIETNPFCQERVAHANMERLGVVHEAWAPFAEGLHDIFKNPVLESIASAYGKTTGQVILRALIQQGVTVIPKSVHKSRMEENYDVFDFELTPEDMERFAALDDPAYMRILDHRNLDTVSWLLEELVAQDQLHGEKLY